MNILMLLTNPFKPDPRVYEEAKVLRDTGYQVTILAWDREKKYPLHEEIDGIQVERLRIYAGYGEPGSYISGIIQYYIHTLLWAQKRNFNIVHANDFDTLPLAILLKKLHGWKVVYDAHDHYSAMISDVIPSPIAHLIGVVEQKFLNFTDALIAATEPLAELIFHSRKYTVIMNAKRITEYRISNQKLKRFMQSFNPGGLFTIVYIGILDTNRPLPIIINAVRDLDGVLLIIGGRGPHEKEILDMIKGAKNIKYIGWVNQKDVPLYTLASDLIILTPNPSKDYTRIAVANKLMEALAAGKPVISSSGTAGGDIVKECQAGFICKYGDLECIREKIMMQEILNFGLSIYTYNIRFPTFYFLQIPV